MQQNSDNWTQWRKKGIGSSDAPVIMGVSPWKTPLQLWEEKLGLSVGFQGNFATQRGHDMEPKARAAFELLMGADFPPVVAEHTNYPHLRASLDGFNSELNAVLEIKCPGKDDHDLAKEGKVPDKYWPQLQHQLLVTGAEKVYYYSYDGESGAVVEVKPDMLYIQKLMEEENKFWDKIQNKIAPEATDKDAATVDSKEYLDLAAKYIEVDAQIGELEKQLKDLKAQIVKGCTHAKTKIGRLTITKSLRSGNVDYSKIPELDGVDVEQYRKEPTQVVTIKVGK